MKYAYYPGCSLESTGKEYDISVRAAAESLGLELVELEDWNCCGATSAHSLDNHLALTLPARNLGIAEKTGLDVTAPCAACYNRMKTAEKALKGDPKLREEINKETGKDYEGKAAVYSLLEVFAGEEMKGRIAERVTLKLDGLKVACYYGCLLTRPAKVTGYDRYEDPQNMDEIMSLIGAEPVDWYFKTECCGASFGVARASTVERLTAKIIEDARANGADCVVTACPLCMTNLEMRQGELNMPIFYFTELLALALGSEGIQKCFASHLVDVNSALDKVMK
ncbi:MAG: CoB--CoM heterodisulfide reductase iron-sulfur subunit B family protein [Abditibacteriota bacterium]|nr:CoB--CoM heterodisulfide reductase iron-sulfur subunit B family protein [Abditibacteriota bacterium]